MEGVSAPSKRRLVLLGRLLADYTQKQITSQDVELLTGWSASQVRRDISSLGINCGA